MSLPKSGNDTFLAISLALIKTFTTTYALDMMARSDAEFPMM
jgi:hypothetical protein